MASLWGAVPAPTPAAAQAGEAERARPGANHGTARIGLHAVALVTRVDPAMDGEARTEGYLSQPAIRARVEPRPWIDLVGTLNLEGWTLEGGELNHGIWGEGYVDRRHPHTYLHELVASADAALPGVATSLSAGRGFTPFGTDDPMTRPFAKYPANHHLAQVLERWIVAAAARRGPLILEGALFNGDEPTDPGALGRASRFGDSWAVRATASPNGEAELQASHARVRSPERPDGLGLDQAKWSASARADVADLAGAHWYGLVEWARTEERWGSRRAFTFTTVLAEVEARRRVGSVALRLERTTRPEHRRLLDPFRTPRPHAGLNVEGITRWIIASARAARVATAGPFEGEAFVEGSVARVRELTGSVLDPRDLYGARRLGTLSAGIRVTAGSAHGRMGRYGVAQERDAMAREHGRHPGGGS